MSQESRERERDIRAIEPFGVHKIATALDAGKPRQLAAGLARLDDPLGGHSRDAGADIADTERDGRGGGQAQTAAATRPLLERRTEHSSSALLQRYGCAACNCHGQSTDVLSVLFLFLFLLSLYRKTTSFTSSSVC